MGFLHLKKASGGKKKSMVKTQEEMLEELLTEVQQTRRYAERLHQSSTRVISLVKEMLENQDPTILRSDADKARYEGETLVYILKEE